MAMVAVGGSVPCSDCSRIMHAMSWVCEIQCYLSICNFRIIVVDVSFFGVIPATIGHPTHGGRRWGVSISCLDVVCDLVSLDLDLD